MSAVVAQVQPVDDLMDLLGDSMPATTQQSAAPSQVQQLPQLADDRCWCS